MLCLVSGSSVSTNTASSVRAQLSREHGCAVSDSMALIRMLQHVHLSIQRAVTTPSVIASSAVH